MNIECYRSKLTCVRRLILTPITLILLAALELCRLTWTRRKTVRLRLAILKPIQLAAETPALPPPWFQENERWARALPKAIGAEGLRAITQITQSQCAATAARPVWRLNPNRRAPCPRRKPGGCSKSGSDPIICRPLCLQRSKTQAGPLFAMSRYPCISMGTTIAPAGCETFHLSMGADTSAEARMVRAAVSFQVWWKPNLRPNRVQIRVLRGEVRPLALLRSRPKCTPSRCLAQACLTTSTCCRGLRMMRKMPVHAL